MIASDSAVFMNKWVNVLLDEVHGNHSDIHFDEMIICKIHTLS